MFVYGKMRESTYLYASSAKNAFALSCLLVSDAVTVAEAEEGRNSHCMVYRDRTASVAPCPEVSIEHEGFIKLGTGTNHEDASHKFDSVVVPYEADTINVHHVESLGSHSCDSNDDNLVFDFLQDLEVDHRVALTFATDWAHCDKYVTVI